MTCYHPSSVHVRRKTMAHLYGSYVPKESLVTVPCGHCLGCRTDQAKDWAVRFMHEQITRPPGYFLTLTYAPEALPDDGTLEKRDPTLFLKRLRKRLAQRISYYVCGEYGERGGRPHYHAALFGARLLDRAHILDRNGLPVWQSPTIDAAWGSGRHELTPLTEGNALYIARYVTKKVRKADAGDHYTRVRPDTGELVELDQEYSTMSRRPALGRDFIKRYWRDVYPRDFVTFNGKECKPPRYYDRWMDQDHSEKEPECNCDEHRKVMESVRLQRMEDVEEIGDEKLIMAEKIHRARVALFNPRDAV